MLKRDRVAIKRTDKQREKQKGKKSEKWKVQKMWGKQKWIDPLFEVLSSLAHPESLRKQRKGQKSVKDGQFDVQREGKIAIFANK